VRIPYQIVSLPSGRAETRPCCDIVFCDDPDLVPYQALIDSGSLHTVAAGSALEGIDLGDPVDRLHQLCFAGWTFDRVPVYRMDLRVVAPPTWPNIDLPDVPVAVVADAQLPFVILGSTALTHLVYIVNDADQRVHLKQHQVFTDAPHYHDRTF
jgi:hypothetical protein